MSDSASFLMEAVADVARLAGEVALRHFRSGVVVESKPDGSPVTAADREAEIEARSWIESRFPADGILGEEFGLARGDASRRWLIDPIDGTHAHVRDVPLWGTLVAVVEQEEVLASAVFFPVFDDMLSAAPGSGCWLNGMRCSVSSVSDLARATVLTTDEQFRSRPARHAAWQRLAGRARLSRTWGDCYGYMLVATGRAEVMADAVLSPWDAAPLLPLIEEAGGVFTDWDGNRTPFAGSAIATNRALADEVRALLSTEGDSAVGRSAGPAASVKASDTARSQPRDDA